MATSAERFGDDFGGERMWGLRELPYPDPVAFVPETLGWAVLAGLGLIGLAYLGWRARQRWLANAYRREALDVLADLNEAQAERLPFILRRTALQAAPRSTVASLRGTAWIDWLNGRTARPVFEATDAVLLDQLAYGTEPIAADAFDRLIDASRRWVREHRA